MKVSNLLLLLIVFSLPLAAEYSKPLVKIDGQTVITEHYFQKAWQEHAAGRTYESPATQERAKKMFLRKLVLNKLANDHRLEIAPEYEALVRGTAGASAAGALATTGGGIIEQLKEAARSIQDNMKTRTAPSTTTIDNRRATKSADSAKIKVERSKKYANSRTTPRAYTRTHRAPVKSVSKYPQTRARRTIKRKAERPTVETPQPSVGKKASASKKTSARTTQRRTEKTVQ
ncbi:hypothetical protein J120_00225 [candidate division TM6 bacterium JCVI TM6SC1]|uniref:Uncharacterized protein n=1 Tax=candidate division TM6 bacterium JCVI TM6SC1 TaxID=1306947 RepID=A0A0D2GPS8_9BACT|nr:hypothetical protein J120_00225 [candidate division TM6 bacterium JCVI TM6SC1]